ncbi:AAA family ATPase [Saccharopolyspora sp. K220]|uniref:UvrD-helicase domain-containing protein n=1 Tax=Saccharopolyspora soli TaxID=2926618 RepID=UPI001F5A1E80|nr:UvrD-helicase domain-containing protein [Saccharopolyspora soli]MCI2421095.1 AAA family ATPase [Saccharopolyspora soli]
MSAFTPTEEQQVVIDILLNSQRLKVVAGAGAGKTETLKQCATRLASKKVLYTAFNRDIVKAGSGKFPKNTNCFTSHKLAYDAVAKPYVNRLNESGRMPWRVKAEVLGITEGVKITRSQFLGAGTLAGLVSEGVENFCRGSEAEIDWHHLPKIDGLHKSQNYQLRTMLLPYAKRYWEDLRRTDAQGGGRMPFTPNHFRKIWQLGEPILPYDVVLLDEAQDTAEVFMDVVRRQSAQTVLIGDTAQSVNEWAGATNAIEHFNAPELRLTRSFRFGVEVAEEGNKWLSLLRTDMRITGTGHSRVGDVPNPTAVLTRTNGEAVRQLMLAQDAGLRVGLAGGKARTEITQLCRAADDLKRGKGTWVKALMAFTYWDELQQYAEDEARDLLPFVRMVDTCGTDTIRSALKNLVTVDRADRVISTAHVSKGLEFRRVKIGEDFTEPVDEHGSPIDPTTQDIKLAYVAVTRAMQELELGGLAWINDRLPGRARGNPVLPTSDSAGR